MEWVETTGKSVAEAQERALDQLGVAREDAEFEILVEPKQGLFGRLRGEARVRARVRPTQARPKLDRRDRRKAREARAATETAEAVTTAPSPTAPSPTARRSKSSPAKSTKSPSSGGSPASTPSAAPKENNMNNVDAHQVGAEAVRFVQGLLDAFGLHGDVSLVEDGTELEVQVDGNGLGLLVGPRGTTLTAVQDVARVASQRRLGDHDTRLRVDIGGYRERRRAALGAFAMQMADEVQSAGVARVLEPMSSADRKIIHDALTDVDGIETRSEGDDPYRRVIIAPAND